ncbi:MAG: hypothetical protein F6K36_08605 [Symploca sp. SIO3C6]|nr:hypothetical protein [Symploca sp. SIO3C6]
MNLFSKRMRALAAMLVVVMLTIMLGANDAKAMANPIMEPEAQKNVEVAYGIGIDYDPASIVETSQSRAPNKKCDLTTGLPCIKSLSNNEELEVRYQKATKFNFQMTNLEGRSVAEVSIARFSCYPQIDNFYYLEPGETYPRSPMPVDCLEDGLGNISNVTSVGNNVVQVRLIPTT